jgi:hypothetical protein
MSEAEDLFRRGFSQTRAAGCYPEMKPAYLVWGDLCTDEGRHPEAEQHYPDFRTSRQFPGSPQENSQCCQRGLWRKGLGEDLASCLTGGCLAFCC